MVVKNVDDVDVIIYLGYSYCKFGVYDIVKSYYFVVLLINDNYVGVNEYLGEFYVELGELDKVYV